MVVFANRSYSGAGAAPDDEGDDGDGPCGACAAIRIGPEMLTAADDPRCVMSAVDFLRRNISVYDMSVY